MDNRVNDIFSRRMRAGSRTYFFDVKVNSREDKYLVVTESRKTGPDLYQHDRVMVFEENMPNFFYHLYEALTEIGIDVSNPPQPVETEAEGSYQRRGRDRNYEADDTETIPRGITSDGKGFARPQRHSHSPRRFDNRDRDGGRDRDRDSGGSRSPYSRPRHHNSNHNQHSGGGAPYRARGNGFTSRPHSHSNDDRRSNYRPNANRNQRSYSSYNDKKAESTPPAQRFYSTGGFDEF